MALTVTENFRMTAGGRAWRMYDITHDESTSTLYTASLDLKYIECIVGASTRYSSSPADHCTFSINADHKSIDISLPAKAASVTHLTVIGW